MMKKVVSVIIVLIVIAIAFVFYFSNLEGSPKQTAEDFTQRLFLVAPPKLDKTAIKQTVAALSQKSASKIKSLTDIAIFADVQKLPEHGYEVLSVNQDKDNAVVVMKWNYTKGPILKRFYLIQEKGKWKISSIERI